MISFEKTFHFGGYGDLSLTKLIYPLLSGELTKALSNYWTGKNVTSMHEMCSQPFILWYATVH